MDRATQGVRIMRLNQDDKPVAVPKVAAEDDAEEGEEAGDENNSASKP